MTPLTANTPQAHSVEIPLPVRLLRAGLSPRIRRLEVVASGTTFLMRRVGQGGTLRRRRTSFRVVEIIMWVRIGSFLIKPGQAANLRATYNERAVPRVRAQAGNLACLLLEPSAEGDPFLVMTVWKDRAAAESYESSGAAGEVVSLVRDLFAGPPTLRSYESASIAGLLPQKG